jgi:hypothetical protein
MQRRQFLGTGLAAGAVALGATAGAAGAAEKPKKQVIELRLYRLDAGPMREKFEKFLADVAIPVWNRIGVKPVGVFSMTEGTNPNNSKIPVSTDLYVLLPHESGEAFATADQRLWADAEYQKAGEAVINAPKESPAYRRIESSVMLAFDAVPQVVVPTTKDTRVLQMRTYESHSDLKAHKKMEMFQAGGELKIFARAAMTPVFFGETLAGSKIPNLTYMLSFEDMAAQKAGWAKFGADPEWSKLSGAAEYKDTVSAITNMLLKPLACSQV